MSQLSEVLNEVLTSIRVVERDLSRITADFAKKEAADLQTSREVSSIRETVVRIETEAKSFREVVGANHLAIDSRVKSLEEKVAIVNQTARSHEEHAIQLTEIKNKLDTVEKEVNKLDKFKVYIVGLAAGAGIIVSAVYHLLATLHH